MGINDEKYELVNEHLDLSVKGIYDDDYDKGDTGAKVRSGLGSASRDKRGDRG